MSRVAKRLRRCRGVVTEIRPLAKRSKEGRGEQACGHALQVLSRQIEHTISCSPQIETKHEEQRAIAGAPQTCWSCAIKPQGIIERNRTDMLPSRLVVCS